MPLFLRESEVEELLTMDLAIEAVEEAFRLKGKGRVENPPRHRLQVGPLMMRAMSASLNGMGLGLKAYTGIKRGSRYLTLLWNASTGALDALIESRKLTQMRTGAASGVASKYMAIPEVTTVGLLGSGWQARSQLEAMCAVRPVEKAFVYSQPPDHRRAFAEEMSDKLGIDVKAVATPQEAVYDVGILIAISTADHPLFEGTWLRKGIHINAAGTHTNEIDMDTISQAKTIAIDDRAQGIEEAGDLIRAAKEGVISWENILELGQLVTGQMLGRQDQEEITLFVSLGIAIEDVAVARRVYEKALIEGAGTPFPDTILG